jgi:hypothetical protein
MGRVRTSRRRTHKTKEYKKSHKTDNRARDVDQIQDDLKKEVAYPSFLPPACPGLWAWPA